MTIDPGYLGVAMMVAALAVFGLFFHYIRRVGRRYDMLCFFGLLGSGTGLQAGAFGLRAADTLTPHDFFLMACISLSLCFIAFCTWREGLKRFRETG